MFKVSVDKIIPVTNARAQIASLVKNVKETKSLYVLTRGGKPAAVLASIDYINNRMKNLPAKKESESQIIETNQEEGFLKTNDGSFSPSPKNQSDQKEIIYKNDSNQDPDKNNNQRPEQIPAHEKEQPIKISLD